MQGANGIVNYANRFYDTARNAASKTIKHFRATHPTFVAGGVYVIYCGLAQQ